MVPPRDSRDPFRLLFDAQAGYVLGRLRWLGVPTRDRLDVAQQVFVDVARHLGELDPARPVRPWLLAITCNRARDYHKRARVRHEQLDGLDVDTVTAPEDRAVDRLDAARTLRRCLASLSYEHREILVLVVLEERTVPEAAEVLGVDVKALESRLLRAREALAAAVGRLQAADRRRLGHAAAGMPVLLHVERLLRDVRELDDEDLAAEVEQLRARFDTFPPAPARAAKPRMLAARTCLVLVTVSVALVGVDGKPPAQAVTLTTAAKRETRNELEAAPASSTTTSPGDGRAPAEMAKTTATGAPSAARRGPERQATDAPSARAERVPVVEPSIITSSAASSTRASPVPSEGELLTLARLALREGDPRRALQFLRQHEAAYPDGVLRPERIELLGRVPGPR